MFGSAGIVDGARRVEESMVVTVPIDAAMAVVTARRRGLL
jgi:hypothetical protein